LCNLTGQLMCITNIVSDAYRASSAKSGNLFARRGCA